MCDVVLILGRRAIEGLSVICSSSDDCEWVGSVSTLEDHLITCQYVLVPCPKQCGDDDNIKKVRRKSLDDHLKNRCPFRQYKCQYCGEEGNYAGITEVHDLICERKRIPCNSSGCHEMVQRCDIDKHLSTDCGHAIVSCKYVGFGCDVKMKRQDLMAHGESNRQNHLDMAMEVTLTLKAKVEELERFKRRVENNWDGAVFTEPGGKDHNLTTTVEGEFVSLNVNESRSLGEEQNKSDQTAEKSLVSPTDGSEEGKNKTSEVVEESSFVSAVSVSKFSAKKAVNRCFQSQPFYTKTNHNISLHIFTNGDGPCIDTHVSAFVCVKPGYLDNFISWPLLGKVTIMLVNQLEDKNHHIMSLDLLHEHDMRCGKKQGSQSFISHEKLSYNGDKNTQYLKDDTLQFKVYFKSPSS